MRGEIRERAFKQVHDYSALAYNKITPTDLDGFVEFGNRLFIFFELKHGDAQMPRGQELALVRLCDAIQHAPAYLLIASHTHSADEDINAAQAIVTRYRTGGRWSQPAQPINLRDAIDRLYQLHISAN